MISENIEINEAVLSFELEGTLVGVVRFGKGHINDTFAAYTQLENGDFLRYIVQRINPHVFKKPNEVMANIWGVTEHLKKIIVEKGGDINRETLSIIKTKDGKNFFTDSQGAGWRCYPLIEDTYCYQTIEKPEHFYNSAYAFGSFQKNLSEYPAETLFETIPNFHNTPKRFERLMEVVSEDKLCRAASVKEEIEFYKARKDDCAVLVNMLNEGKLPLRVTHNDTKLNNVMFDKKTDNVICVIDLDTVMPGLAAYDFGDSVRFGASTAAEDETDLSKVNFSLELYETYARGFLEAAKDALTENEVEFLPWGAKLMTLECGMRFLTDHLEGDVYFKTHRENHNLDRARTQIKLVKDMEKCWDSLFEIIRRY